jgi:cytochrome b6-f complex iron-sulfur subunit
MASEERENRRDFLNRVIVGLFSLSALIIGVPLIRFLFPPSQIIERRGRKMPVGKVSDIPDGSSKTVLFDGRPVILINYGGKINAVSAICPHMGCFLRWDEKIGQIKCPCHFAVFNVNGSVISGPSPEPLKTYRVEISDNRIFIIKE